MPSNGSYQYDYDVDLDDLPVLGVYLTDPIPTTRSYVLAIFEVFN